MKKINKFILWFLIAFLFVICACAVTVGLYAKPFITGQLEKNLNTRVTLEKVNFSLPFGIILTNLNIGDLFKADKISFSLPANVKLVNPVVNLVQDENKKLNLPKLKEGGNAPAIVLTGVSIENGRLIFSDKTVSPEGFKVILDKINGRVSKVNFPLTSLDARFAFSAEFVTESLKHIGSINFSGWANFIQKSMDAKLQISDLDVTHFSPYYGDFISSRKLLSAKLNTVSVFKAENNELVIDTHFKLSDLIYAQEQSSEGELPTLDITKSALDLFTDRDGKLILDFRLKSKFDKPEFNTKQLKKVILNAAAKNLANQPPEDVAQKISDTIEKFKDFGEQMQKIFKGKD